MKVTTDGCLFGAWAAKESQNFIPLIRTALDIGTGTGLLSLMLAQNNPSVQTDAVEVDKGAAEQATQNIAASPYVGRIKVLQGDARETAFNHKYDIIISNPPFYEKELKGDNTKKNIAHHNEGLLLTELLTIISTNLEVNGTFFLLLPFKRLEEASEIFPLHDLAIQKQVLVKQSTGHDYFRVMLAGKMLTGNHTAPGIEEITIKDQANNYTPSFILLLRDYYLLL